jgi:drug/metabolite transporter (DMT)-like permease
LSLRVSRSAALALPALVAFAANSLLCRRALGLRLIDPASFTSIRLISGTIILVLIAGVVRRSGPRAGSWISALMLFSYAATFSASYVRIGAGIGSLLLFGSVQATMLGWGVVRGERPTFRQWIGILLALVGLASLTLPGSHAPDGLGAALMICAGISWGIYSLRGRRVLDPIVTTGDNFLRTVPLTAVLSLISISGAHASASGVYLAIASGALASGLGYILWYAALPLLSATQAAAVQLSAPILAASGAVLFLGESVTLRLVASGAAILCGVWLAIQKQQRRR